MNDSSVVFQTDGYGLWSCKEQAVRITNMKIASIDEEFDAGTSPEYGELRVYFDTKTWKVNKQGLIYTDRQFLRELREFLDLHGLPGSDVDYSEQGMQGNNYVSCDVGTKFIKAWGEKFGIDWNAQLKKQRAAFRARWGYNY